MKTYRPAPLMVLVLNLALALPAFAGPQILSEGLNLSILDMNGAPFRTFHLGLYNGGLDTRTLDMATALPSDELTETIASADDNSGLTGVAAEPPSSLPTRPDISPLVGHYYQDTVLRAGPAR